MTNSNQSPSLPEIKDWLSSQKEIVLSSTFELSPLDIQASSRLYYRVLDNNKSFVVVFTPKLVEEKTSAPHLDPQEGFLKIAHFLKERGVRVPEIYFSDVNNRMMLLKDLGSQNLEKKQQNLPAEQKLSLYQKVITNLADFQNRILKEYSFGYAKASQNLEPIIATRHFDQNLVLAEWQHFLDYSFGKEKPTDSTQKKIALVYENLITHWQKLPFGITHRDFQSRNIMFCEEQIYWIDFQDMLIAPLVYDLVSLLNDSYISFTDQELQKLKTFYLENLKSHHPYYQKLDQLLYDFSWVSIQRKLKDQARFRFIDEVKGNPDFLPHVWLSLDYAERSARFLKQDVLIELTENLKKQAP